MCNKKMNIKTNNYNDYILKIFRLKDMNTNLIKAYFKFYLKTPLLIFKNL